MGEIAKYRDPQHPDRWYLSDFTMEQVEKRITTLRAKLAEAQAHLRCSNSNVERQSEQLDELRAEVERLREDKARLDAFEPGWLVVYRPINESGEMQWFVVQFYDDNEILSEADTLREAIDAARRKTT